MASSDFEKAKSYFLEGVFHAENENWGQAEVSFKASHDILPGRASTVSNLLGVLVAQKNMMRLGSWSMMHSLLVVKVQKQIPTLEFYTTSHKILKKRLSISTKPSI